MLRQDAGARDAAAEVLDRLVEAAAALCAAASAAWLLDETNGLLSFAAGRGLPAGWPPTGSLPPAEAPGWAEALARGAAILDPSAVPPTGGLPPACTSALCVLLGPQAEPKGLLCLYRTAPPRRPAAAFAARDAESARALAALAAAGLDAVARRAAMEREQADRVQLQRVVSHELRSPITVALSLLRNVLRGYTGPLNDLQRDVFVRIAGQLEALSNLIDDYLDLAASRSARPAGEGPVVVNASLARAALLLQPRAEEQGVTLHLCQCPDELVTWATEEGLDHIFTNLVDNAVKYTPPGGTVTVSLSRSGTEAAASVADTGIGIPPEALPHLFEEFYRAPNARALKAVGTGLGLAIVKGLVDRFRGRIDVESAPGRGAVFTVRLPLCSD